MVEVPTIEEWLTGKNICITGVTGFIGKVLLEKLMRCCPDHGNIYLLIRSKRGQTAADRYNEIVNCDLFTFADVKYHFDRLKVIPTDFSVAHFGFTDEIRKELHDNVNIIFHVAASIKFIEPLCDAIKINTRITRDMIFLAKKMKNLEAFAHVSTAYANCDRIDIDEIVYPSKMDWRAAIELAETADPEVMDSVTERALGEVPNTYCFTKLMGEHVVWDHRHELPILIYRPVIVINIKEEPEPGWSNNFSGPEILILAIGKGILRAVYCDGNIRVNYCPCDITVNGLIVATWKMACHSKITNEPYDQVICSNHVKKTPNECIEVGHAVVLDQPFTDIVWKPHFVPIENEFLFYWAHIFINCLPNIFFQVGIKAFLGKNIPLNKIMRKTYVVTTILLRFFAGKEYNMKFDNFNKLENSLCESDRKKFYMKLYQKDDIVTGKGITRIMKITGERDIPKDQIKKHQKRMYIIDQIFRYSMVTLFVVFFPYKFVFSLLTGSIACLTSGFYET